MDKIIYVVASVVATIVIVALGIIAIALCALFVLLVVRGVYTVFNF